jgi:hypothetical protein
MLRQRREGRKERRIVSGISESYINSEDVSTVPITGRYMLQKFIHPMASRAFLL